VIDVSSGRPVGRIAGTFDDVFVLARRSWKVVSRERDVIRAPLPRSCVVCGVPTIEDKGEVLSELPRAFQSTADANQA